jgi:dual specificity MAP kinase phosphatase
LKGAVAPEELLCCANTPSPRSPTCLDGAEEEVAKFLEIDPRDGFGVRNFQIQACKIATVSDIVVYGAEDASREEVQAFGRQIARAQKTWREKSETCSSNGEHLFNTFVVSGMGSGHPCP